MASRNNTHVTFSWDIVDGNSGAINDFVIQWGGTGFTFDLRFPYNDVNLNKELVPHFEYTTTFLRFGIGDGYYLMWLVVNRNGITPAQTYSRQIFAEIGKFIRHTYNGTCLQGHSVSHLYSICLLVYKNPFRIKRDLGMASRKSIESSNSKSTP